MSAPSPNAEPAPAPPADGESHSGPAGERLLAYVDPGLTSDRMLRAAQRLADELGAEWTAVNVETRKAASLSAQSRQRLAYSLSLAERLGADTITLHGEQVAETLLEYARAQDVTLILVGSPPERRWLPSGRRSVLRSLLRLSGDIPVCVVPGAEELPVREPPPPAPWAPWSAYRKAAGIGALSGALAALFEHIWMPQPHVVITFILGVILVSAKFGRGPGLLAALAGASLFALVYTVEPGCPGLPDLPYLFTFAVTLCAVLITGSLTEQIRLQAHSLQQRDLRVSALFRLSERLAGTSGVQPLAEAAERQLHKFLGAKVAVLLPHGADGLAPVTDEGKGFELGPREADAAHWAFEHGYLAGAGMDSVSNAAGLYVPMVGPHAAIGVIGLRDVRPGSPLANVPRRMLMAFATQIALAIEREQMADAARKSLVQAEAERLRSALLSSVSHDLRTPLATIAGASSALLELQHIQDAETRQQLLHTICDQANHLNQLVENILQMTRIESGSLVLHKEWQPIEEVIGSALERVRTALADRPVHTQVPEGLPMAPFDGVLIQRVLVNLLDNAIKYTPPGSPIEVSAAEGSKQLIVEVADRGPGLPEEERQRVFEKFYRVRRPGVKAPTGTGLGLSICQAIVEAHGGRIWAENRPEGGACFRFALPIEGEPPSLAAEEEDVTQRQEETT